jgi:flagellar protein FlgJ
MDISPVGVSLQTGVAKPKEDKELRKACRDFEVVFNDMVFKAMRKTVSKNDLYGSNKEEEMFSDMLDTKISEQAAETNPSGIGAMLYRQLSVNLKIGSADKKGDVK